MAAMGGAAAAAAVATRAEEGSPAQGREGDASKGRKLKNKADDVDEEKRHSKKAKKRDNEGPAEEKAFGETKQVKQTKKDTDKQKGEGAAKKEKEAKEKEKEKKEKEKEKEKEEEEEEEKEKKEKKEEEEKLSQPEKLPGAKDPEVKALRVSRNSGQRAGGSERRSRSRNVKRD